MKKKHRKFSTFFMLLVLMHFLVAFPAMAAQVRLAWDANTESDIAGYRLYYNTQSGVYSISQMVQVLGINNTQSAVTALTGGITYYFVVTAFNTSDLESDYSNEVSYTPPAGTSYSLDATYTASGLTINMSSGIISGNISTLPADPKSIYWAKGGLNVSSGQVLTMGGRMYYNGDSGPVSVYLADQATGNWLSPERVIFLDNTYSQYQADLIVFNGSSNAKLYVSCGHRKGLYQFQRISIGVTAQTAMPITDLYLSQLLPKQAIGLYSVEWAWNPAPGSQGYMVRVTPFRDEIEKGASGIMLSSQMLSASQTAFKRDIDATLYGGVYVAVSSLAGGRESVPWITWYLPGGIFSTADDDVPPLTFQAVVNINDVNYAYAGYRNALRVPALTPGSLAGREERTDIDNNGYAGRVSDYSFIRSQYLNGRRMQ